jgi:hypothetical protein
MSEMYRLDPGDQVVVRRPSPGLSAGTRGVVVKRHVFGDVDVATDAGAVVTKVPAIRLVKVKF